VRDALHRLVLDELPAHAHQVGWRGDQLRDQHVPVVELVLVPEGPEVLQRDPPPAGQLPEGGRTDAPLEVEVQVGLGERDRRSGHHADATARVRRTRGSAAITATSASRLTTVTSSPATSAIPTMS